MRDQQKFKYETKYGSPFVVEGVGLDVGVCCHPALPSPRGVEPSSSQGEVSHLPEFGLPD